MTAALTDEEWRAGAKESARVTHMLAATRLAEAAAAPDTEIEVIRKIYNDTKDVAGAVEEKKLNPYGNLPVFNITFHNGGVTATMTPVNMGAAEVIELAPTPAMLADLGVNAEILELAS
jgi:hypothetical protein